MENFLMNIFFRFTNDFLVNFLQIRSCLEDPEEFSKIVWGDSEIPFVPIDKTSYLWTKPSLTESGTIS